MKTGYTDITVVLDKSGSMSVIDADTVGSLNSFVKEQAKLDGECTISLFQFSNKTEPTYEQVAAGEIKPLVLNESYVADGPSTALLDSIGQTIQKIGSRYAKMRENQRPEKVIFVIITDGQENSSREFNRSKIFDMITEQEEKYKWEFIFLGANQDAIATGAQMGFKAGNSLSFAYTGKGIEMASAAFTSKVSAYRSCGFMSDFSEEDRKLQKDEGSL